MPGWAITLLGVVVGGLLTYLAAVRIETLRRRADEKRERRGFRNGIDERKVDLENCRRHSFTFLYRLLFIMFAEDRQLLPYRGNRQYTNNRSLGRYRDQIATRLDHVAAGLEEV